MLHRFLFVAGMTVGVMTPLVWTAYVSRPPSHQTQAPVTAKATPVMPKPAPVAAKRTATTEATKKPTKAVRTEIARTEDITASIPPASLKPMTRARYVARAKPRTPPHPVRHAKLTRPRSRHATLVQPHRMVRGTEDRIIPAVVNRYNGAHIIIVCAALTVNEQLRAGCP
jgi:hypothetical protein